MFTKMICLNNKFSALDFASFCITIIAIILTFGRVAIAGTAAGIIISYFICGKGKNANKVLNVTLFLALFFSLIYFFFGNSVVITRLLGRGDSTMVSTSTHSTITRNALNVIKSHWLVGVGIGTQGYTRGNLKTVITDGGWLAWFLELGIPVTIIYFLLIVCLIIFSYRTMNKTKVDSKEKKSIIFICTSFITVTLFYVAASLVNSAYSAIANYGNYWVITGCMLSCYDTKYIQQR